MERLSATGIVGQLIVAVLGACLLIWLGRFIRSDRHRTI